MAQEILVIDSLMDCQKHDGWQLLLKLAKNGFDVHAAAWVVRPSREEQRRWHLYIVTKAASQNGTGAAYKSIIDVLRELPDSSVLPTDTKFVGPDTPIGQDLTYWSQKHKTEFWSGGPWLGDLAIDWAYIYPPVANS